MSAVIPIDTLLMAMEEQETDFAKKDILRAAREELEAMADDIAWVHVLISYYAAHHLEGLKAVPYMSRKDGEDKIAKYCRNSALVDALVKKYPWLKMSAIAPEGEIDTFDKAYRVTEATEAKIQELIPRPIPIEEAEEAAPDVHVIGDLEEPAPTPYVAGETFPPEVEDIDEHTTQKPIPDIDELPGPQF